MKIEIKDKLRRTLNHLDLATFIEFLGKSNAHISLYNSTSH